jgi:hypothetical protein
MVTIKSRFMIRELSESQRVGLRWGVIDRVCLMSLFVERLITATLALAIVTVMSTTVATVQPEPALLPDAVDAATLTAEARSGSAAEVVLRGRLSL